MIGIPERLHGVADVNRHERRRNLRYSPCRQMEDKVIEAAIQFNEADGNRQTVRREVNGDLAATIYTGEGVGATFVDATRQLPLAMGQAMVSPICNEHRKWLSKIKYPDHFGFKVNGASLADIEGMHLPLRAPDISRINGILRGSPKEDFAPGVEIARQVIVYTDVDPLVNPEQIVGPGLRPLRSRLEAYFGFYGGYLTAQNTEMDQDRRFLSTLRWAGSFFGTSIGLHVGASEGLSPSSVMKLFDEHIKGAGYGKVGDWVTGDLVKEITGGMKYAYYPQGNHALPDKVQQYLVYDPRADKNISRSLEKVYAGGPISSAPIEHEEVKTLVSKLRGLRNIIISDAAKDGLGAPEFRLDDHPLIDSVLLGLRSSQSHFKENITAVLLTKDGVPLTIDLPPSGRLVYGLPTELQRKVPHIEELLVGDVVKTLIDQIKKRHPELEPRDKVVVLPKPIVRTSEVNSTDSEGDELEVDLPAKLPKRKRLKETFEFITKKPEPEEPKPAASFQRSFTVNYTEASIRKLMRHANEDDIQGAIVALKRFEVGGERSRKVRSEDGVRRVRFGDWRIKLDYQGGTIFNLEDIVRRPKAYKQ